jgi:AcrR family transcriptional regulator
MSKGRETRGAVLDRALEISSTLGIEGLTLGNLARELGMSKSGLFAHFLSKEQLQLDVIRLAADRFTELVVAPALRQARGEPRFRALFENWMRWDNSAEMPGGCVFMTYAHELDDRPGPLRDAMVIQLRRWVEALQKAARIAVEEGHFKADLDVEQFVLECYGTVLAFNHFKRTLEDPSAEVRTRRAFDALIQRARR